MNISLCLSSETRLVQVIVRNSPFNFNCAINLINTSKCLSALSIEFRNFLFFEQKLF